VDGGPALVGGGPAPVAGGPASVAGGPAPGGGRLEPASGGGLRLASVPVPTRLGRGGAGTTGGRWRWLARRRVAQWGRWEGGQLRHSAYGGGWRWHGSVFFCIRDSSLEQRR
jgi:hypothetical protein